MTFFDLFAGIGGFRSGLEAVGGFRCVGYCEIDPYPRRAYEALYDTREEMFFPDPSALTQQVDGIFFTPIVVATA